MMSLWPKQEHLCHSGASLALLTITTDKHEQLCLNIVYRHRWAFLHLRSLCLGLLPGSRRPFSLVVSRGKGSVASQRGRLVPSGVVSNSWLLFWLRVSHVYPGLPLSVCCGLLVRANFRLGWTFSKVKVVLQDTRRCCFSRADLHASCQETVLNLPLLLPPEKVMFSVLSHLGVENFALSTSWAHISMKVSVRGLGFLSGHNAFFLTALWVVHDWQSVRSNLRHLSTLLLSQKHQAPLCLLFENPFCRGLALSSHYIDNMQHLSQWNGILSQDEADRSSCTTNSRWIIKYIETVVCYTMKIKICQFCPEGVMVCHRLPMWFWVNGLKHVSLHREGIPHHLFVLILSL